MKAPSEKKGKYQNTGHYLDAALEIVREHGVEQLTMRKMAQHMGVSPMAVYKHFANKDELLKATLDAFIARADVIPDATLPWDSWIEQMAHRMFDALCSDVRWLSILGATGIGPNALRVTTAFLDKLQAAGFSPAQALDAYLAVIHTLIGAVSLQTAMDRSSQNIAADFSQAADTAAMRRVASRKQIDISLPLIVASLQGILAKQTDQRR